MYVHIFYYLCLCRDIWQCLQNNNKQNLNYIVNLVSDLENVCIKSLKKIVWEIKGILLANMENSFDYLEKTLKNQTLCVVLSLSLLLKSILDSDDFKYSKLSLSLFIWINPFWVVIKKKTAIFNTEKQKTKTGRKKRGWETQTRISHFSFPSYFLWVWTIPFCYSLDFLEG